MPEPVRAAIEPELRDMGELAGGDSTRAVDAAAAETSRSSRPVGRLGTSRRPTSSVPTPGARRPGRGRAGPRRHRPTSGSTARSRASTSSRWSTSSSPSSAVYSCPLAMTDGAARTLLAAAATRRSSIARVPRLTSRDPARRWTSGQWMTERTGGSDVGQSLDAARRRTATAGGSTARSGSPRRPRRRWRSRSRAPRATRPAGSGLALFYVELRDADGRRTASASTASRTSSARAMCRPRSSRSTARLATAGGRPADGVHEITPMLNVTRTWNARRRDRAACAAGSRWRATTPGGASAFGAPLADKPLHVDTLAALEAEFEGASTSPSAPSSCSAATRRARPRDGSGGCLRAAHADREAHDRRSRRWPRASEVLEAFGGAGYVEDTGLPAPAARRAGAADLGGHDQRALARLLRALSGEAGLRDLDAELSRALAAATDPALVPVRDRARALMDAAGGWFGAAQQGAPAASRAGRGGSRWRWDGRCSWRSPPSTRSGCSAGGPERPRRGPAAGRAHPGARRRRRAGHRRGAPGVRPEALRTSARRRSGGPSSPGTVGCHAGKPARRTSRASVRMVSPGDANGARLRLDRRTAGGGWELPDGGGRAAGAARGHPRRGGPAPRAL